MHIFFLSPPTITNHQYRIDKNYAHKLSPTPRNRTPDILETKYLTPKFDSAKSHKSLTLDQESSTVIADLPEIVPKPRIKR